MAKKKIAPKKTKSVSSKGKKRTAGAPYTLEHDFIIIVGGGLVVIMLMLFFFLQFQI